MMKTTVEGMNEERIDENSLLMPHPPNSEFRARDRGRVNKHCAWRVLGAKQPPSRMRRFWRCGDGGEIVSGVFKVLPQIKRGNWRPRILELDDIVEAFLLQLNFDKLFCLHLYGHWRALAVLTPDGSVSSFCSRSSKGKKDNELLQMPDI